MKKNIESRVRVTTLAFCASAFLVGHKNGKAASD
jgi:hypothetical protein